MADVENAAPAAEVSEGQEVAPEATNEPVVQSEGQPPVEPKEELKQEVKAQIKKLKIKVDGKELEKELDLANEAELIKMLQMSEMSNKRAQEAADLRKKHQARESELNQFLEMLKDKPELILSQLGKNPVELAEKWLADEVEKMQMDPKERRIKELEEEMKKVAEEKAAAKKAQEEAQKKYLRDKYASDYELQLKKAMDTGSIPSEPELVNSMVAYMTKAIEQGLDVSFDEIIPLVKNSHRSIVKNTLKGFSAQELLELLSEAQVNDLLVKKTPKKEKKVVPPTAQQIKDAGESKDTSSGPKVRSESASDFFRNLTMQYAGKE